MWYQLTSDVIHQFHGGKEFDPKRLKAFVEANGFTRYCQPGRQAYHKFLTTGRNTGGYTQINYELPPAFDHGRAFKNTRTGVVCVVSQPYNYLHTVAEECKLWAKERGIAVDLYDSDKSWYYPGSTCLIIWHLSEVPVLLG